LSFALALGFYARWPGGPAVADLVANLDDTLFASVLANVDMSPGNIWPTGDTISLVPGISSAFRT